MISKEKWNEAIGILGELTEEQKAVLEEAAGKPVSEKEFYEKLGKIDEAVFTEFLKAASETKEEAVFSQEVSVEEMASAAGGSAFYGNSFSCTDISLRKIYEPFPNCAATVEEGSWCGRGDACYSEAIMYLDMDECSKAWR